MDKKIIEHSDENCGASIDAGCLDPYHRKEQERIHVALLDEAAKGLADIAAEHSFDIAEARAKYGVRSRGL